MKHQQTISAPKSQGNREEKKAKDRERRVVRHLLGEALAATADSQNTTAIKIYQAALAIDPENIDTHLALGMLYRDMGWRKHAKTSGLKALAIDPKSHIARVLSDAAKLNPLDRLPTSKTIH